MDSSSSTSSTKDKEPFKVCPELFAPTRLAPKVYALFRARSLVINVIAHECLLLILLAAKTTLTATQRFSTTDTSSSSLPADTYPGELPRIGILGGGHIGSAVAMALLRHQYPSDKIAISTRQPERTPKYAALLQSATASQSQLAQFHSIAKYYDNARLSRESDVLVLCMPPSQLKSVTIQIKHALCVSEQPTLVISVLCGASRELLQKSIGSRLVTRAKVNVAKLKGREDPDGGDLKDEDDGNAAANSVAGVGNGREGRGSFVDIAAQELARDQEDVESLLQVLTGLSLRLQAQHQQQQQQQEDNSDGTTTFQEDAMRHARHVLFGVLDHQKDEDYHSTASNPNPNQSSTDRKQDYDQLRLRSEREARGGAGDWRSTDWDELLAVVQRVMCHARAKMSE